MGTATTHSVWLTPAQCDLGEFRAIVEAGADAALFTKAATVEQGVPVYDCDALGGALAAGDDADALAAELAWVLADGPGIAVFRHAYPDTSVVDRASDAFRAMIDEQHAAGKQVGDHYAKPGANDRVWNALEKLAMRNPDVFVDYYANAAVALGARAWLGPGYQVSSQINVVNPGGEAQKPHRDYHLGFMTVEQARQWPIHAHLLSPALTLQGAVAHTDMPVESGPTMLLPYSQRYPLGYLAWWLPEFRAYFDDHRVQLPLRKGDVMFFNPAVFHAAGHNRTSDVKRMANLLQISSAFGRAMEFVDRYQMCSSIFPVLLDRASHGDAGLDHAIAACAEGYAFPTNLDLDPPIGGLAPPTQADVLRLALAERWSPSALAGALAEHAAKRATTPRG